MATTTLLQRHAGEGETIAEAIRDCLDYGKDRRKQKAESISPLMNVIRPPWRTSSFGKGQLCRYDGPGTEERK